MVRQVFKLPLRQTEGFMCSVIDMMGLDLSIPDYSCISKRSIGLKLKRLFDSSDIKVYCKDQWHQEKHKVKAMRSWCKLHLAVDENHQILASDLAEKSVGDTTALAGLLSQAEGFKTFMVDGA
jgi:hypothetical protein